MLELKMNGKLLEYLTLIARNKTYFITIGKTQRFIDNVKKEINKENQVLVMCAAGGRSNYSSI